MKVLKYIASLAVCLLISASVFAQTVMEDVVHLKNGSIIRGQITEQVPTEYIKIKLAGGSILVFEIEEIEKIVKEEAEIQPTYSRKHSKFSKPIYYKGNGFKTYIDFSLGGPIGLSVLSGWQFNKYAFVGAGVGIERFVNPAGNLSGEGFAPVFAGVTGELTDTKVMPYYYANLGYGFPTSSESSDWRGEVTDRKGGLMAGLGLGMKLNTRGKIAYTISMGYRYQKSSSTQLVVDRNNEVTQTIQTNRFYNRFTLRTGISF